MFDSGFRLPSPLVDTPLLGALHLLLTEVTPAWLWKQNIIPISTTQMYSDTTLSIVNQKKSYSILGLAELHTSLDCISSNACSTWFHGAYINLMSKCEMNFKTKLEKLKIYLLHCLHIFTPFSSLRAASFFLMECIGCFFQFSCFLTQFSCFLVQVKINY